MTIAIEFNIEDEGWIAAAPWFRELALKATEQALRAADLAPAPGETVEISVLLCDDARIAALNDAHRGRPSVTNVLSWPAHDLAPPAPGARPPAPPDGALGDIALARQTIEKEAKTQHLSNEAHFIHLFAHGVLHLLGYDHETDEDATLMQDLERVALAAMGVDDPYRDQQSKSPQAGPLPAGRLERGR